VGRPTKEEMAAENLITSTLKPSDPRKKKKRPKWGNHGYRRKTFERAKEPAVEKNPFTNHRQLAVGHRTDGSS